MPLAMKRFYVSDDFRVCFHETKTLVSTLGRYSRKSYKKLLSISRQKDKKILVTILIGYFNLL